MGLIDPYFGHFSALALFGSSPHSSMSNTELRADPDLLKQIHQSATLAFHLCYSIYNQTRYLSDHVRHLDSQIHELG